VKNNKNCDQDFTRYGSQLQKTS